MSLAARLANGGALTVIQPSQRYETLAAMLTAEPPAASTSVLVGGAQGGVFYYDPTSEAETNGCTCFAPTANQTTTNATRGGPTTQPGFPAYQLRGDLNWPNSGAAWSLSTVYTTGDCVLNGGAYYYARQDHTAASTDEPGVGANTDAFWAPTHDAFVEALIPNDHFAYLYRTTSDQSTPNVVWGSVSITLDSGSAATGTVTDIMLHGHNRGVNVQDPPRFAVRAAGETGLHRHRIFWHKIGVLREDISAGNYGEFGTLATVGGTVDYLDVSFKTASAGRWIRVLTDSEPLTPHMIGCTPDDSTVNNYDRFCWLLNAARDQGRDVDLGKHYWYLAGAVIVWEGLRIFGRGRDCSGLRWHSDGLDRTKRYHMASVEDPTSYDAADEALFSTNSTPTAGVKVINKSGTPTIYYFDSSIAAFDTAAEVDAWLDGQGVTSVSFAGTTSTGSQHVFEARHDFSTDINFAVGNGFPALIFDHYGTGYTLHDLEIDGEIDQESPQWWGVGNHGADWDRGTIGGEGSPLSALVRETGVYSGIMAIAEGSLAYGPDFRINLENVWVHDMLGSCLVHGSGIDHFRGRDVKLGNSLSGRVLYGGTGNYENLHLHGHSRTAVHRMYRGRIAGYKYNGEGNALAHWVINAELTNICGMQDQNFLQTDFSGIIPACDVSGIEIDLTDGQGLYPVAFVVGNQSTRLQGVVYGGRAYDTTSSANTHEINGLDIDLTHYIRPVGAGHLARIAPSVLTGADAESYPTDLVKFTSRSPLRNARIRMQHLENWASSVGAYQSPQIPTLRTPNAPIRLDLDDHGTPLATSPNNFRSAVYEVDSQTVVNNCLLVSNVPATLSDAVPQRVVVRNSLIRCATGRPIGWNSATGAVPSNAADSNLEVLFDGVGFWLFDPGNFTPAEADIDQMFAILKLRNSYICNAGDDYAAVSGGQRVWTTPANVNLTAPQFWSETDTVVEFSATGTELTADGTEFYYAFNPGLLWKPKRLNLTANNKVTNDNFTGWATYSGGPINPEIRVYFGAQFSASAAVSFRVEAAVSP